LSKIKFLVTVSHCHARAGQEVSQSLLAGDISRVSRVLVIDTGISAYYGGHMASLLIEGDKLIALQNGVARPVPLGEESLLPYFRSIAEQESIPAALQNLIESLSIAPQLSN